MEQSSSAFVEWINTFADSISHSIHHISELSDGIVLFEVLADIDPKWFKAIRQADIGDNWVLKFNNLKKLHKLVTRFFEEVLGQSTQALEPPNLNLIAKEADAGELLKLCQLVIALAVQSENNQIYIERIQGLSQRAQHTLMLSIEQVMKNLGNSEFGSEPATPQREQSNSYDSGRFYSPQSDYNRLLKEKEDLEKAYKQLIEENGQLQYKYEEMTSEKDELKVRLREMEQSVAQARETGRHDFIMKTEIDHLKQDLERSEEKRQEAEIMIDSLNQSNIELQRKVDELKKEAEEVVRLKDKLYEYKHAADKLQKQENTIEKYRKRLEEAADLRRQIKTLEDQNHNLVERNQQVEDEYRKVLAFKSLMDSYKEQVATLEGKNSELTRQKNEIEFELKRVTSRLEVIHEEQAHDQETIQLLEERLKEYELGGGLSLALGGAASEGREGAGGEVVGTALGDDLEGTTTTGLKLKISRLERELRTLKEEKSEGGSSRAVVLEHLLEDANRMKAKFEQDYLQVHQEKLQLENELARIRSGGKLEDSEFSLTLRTRLNEYEKETSELKRKLAETEVQLKETRNELTVAQSDLNLLGKDQLDAIAEIKKRNATELERLQEDHTVLQQRSSQLEEQVKEQLEQVNRLLREKDELQRQNIETKDQLLEKEKLNSDMKATLAALQSNDNETMKALNAQLQQEVVTLREQTQQMQIKMQKAKEFIKQQDKLFRETKMGAPKENFDEAIQSLNAEIKLREDEITRLRKQLHEKDVLTRREQQLILSAWYDIGRRLQRDSLPAAQRAPSTPVSWLGQQRRNLDAQLKRR
ncbi:uncharacterized protein VTP21DRAFT_4874 [Calcarisporiella thermophila]|uniref:uncharacterized protein n=1 Tax=Calcarisporiella thermophila TaxID=911321 RepID=UPI003742E558